MPGMNNELMRQIIMDHYSYPRNHELIQDERYLSRHMDSESCIDDITVQALIENGTIEDVRFNGEACAISTASTSILSELMAGKSIPEAKNIIDNYLAMIDERDYDESVLEEAIAFQGVGKQANRINCATLGWKAMEEMIEESEGKPNE
ncbi:MAG: SUF system NifU family Fe-S cluster assembly protein [Erysipelotrichaceae bacterium]|nr:SUF system NifU family Fe-S cluster assembly protein [Erysipelotrichaceae bacterium]